MRKPIIAGNWKMNKTPLEAEALVRELIPLVADSQTEVVVCPPFVCLPAVAALVAGTNIALGAQNLHFAPSGAYTGEISAQMLKELGVTYVIIGHSERRQYFAETEAVLAQKYANAVAAGVLPVLCVGETLAEREAGDAETVVAKQLALLQDASLLKQTVLIAYEPVWAIGTGVVASIEQIAQMHAFIQQHVLSLVGNSASMRLLYGGSVNADNCAAIFAVKHVDGALVGGASLKYDSFAQIITAAIAAAN